MRDRDVLLSVAASIAAALRQCPEAENIYLRAERGACSETASHHRNRMRTASSTAIHHVVGMPGTAACRYPSIRTFRRRDAVVDCSAVRRSRNWTLSARANPIARRGRDVRRSGQDRLIAKHRRASRARCAAWTERSVAGIHGRAVRSHAAFERQDIGGDSVAGTEVRGGTTVLTGTIRSCSTARGLKVPEGPSEPRAMAPTRSKTLAR